MRASFIRISKKIKFENNFIAARYKVRNWTPQAIWANYSRVDSGKSDDSGAVLIPSHWDWNHPEDGDKSAFTWVVWPAEDNKNYTTKLTIGGDGDDSAHVTMFLTGEALDHTFGTCQYYTGEQLAACTATSNLTTQFEIAFPTLEVRLPSFFTT